MYNTKAGFPRPGIGSDDDEDYQNEYCEVIQWRRRRRRRSKRKRRGKRRRKGRWRKGKEQKKEQMQEKEG